MTEKAAQLVLNATELALPLQDSIQQNSAQLGAQWEALQAAPFAEADAVRWPPKALSRCNRRRTMSPCAHPADGHHDGAGFPGSDGESHQAGDRTGQRYRTAVGAILVHYSPSEVKREDNGLMNGPQIDAGAKDIIVDQSQVDDLLEKLGF